MSKMKIVTLLVATALVSPAATAGDFASGGQPKMKVKKAQLAIQSPNGGVCPAPAKMTGWLFTNKPGTVHYMIARKGGSVSGPFAAQAVKGSNGIHMASFTRNFPVHASINAEYRILVGKKYGTALSNWAPLSVSC